MKPYLISLSKVFIPSLALIATPLLSAGNQWIAPDFSPPNSVQEIDFDNGLVTFRGRTGNLMDLNRGSSQDKIQLIESKVPEILSILDLPQSLAHQITFDGASMISTGGWIIRLGQSLNGIRFEGGDLIVQLLPNGEIVSVNSTVSDLEGPLSRIRLSSLEVASILVTEHSSFTYINRIIGKSRLEFIRNASDRRVFPVWVCPAESSDLWEIELNAETGKFVRYRDKLDRVLDREVAFNHQQTYPKDPDQLFDPTQPDEPNNRMPWYQDSWTELHAYYMTQAGARSEGSTVLSPEDDVNYLYDHLGTVRLYFSSNFSYTTWANATTLMGLVNCNRGAVGITDYQNQAGFVRGNNLFIFGVADGTTFTSLANDLDIVAHEYAHGVVYERVALTYDKDNHWETVAINEGWSDVMAAGIDSGVSRWELGEDSKVVGAIRSIVNPSLYGGIDYYGDLTHTPHQDSGIISHAFYLLAQGGQHARKNVIGRLVFVYGLGVDRALDIYWDALGALTSEADILEFATELRTKTTDTREWNAALSAFFNVGVLSTMWGTDGDGWKLTYHDWIYFGQHGNRQTIDGTWFYEYPNTFDSSKQEFWYGFNDSSGTYQTAFASPSFHATVGSNFPRVYDNATGTYNDDFIY